VDRLKELLKFKGFQVNQQKVYLRPCSGAGRHGPPGCRALASWAGWSTVQVVRHVMCLRRERNREGSGTLCREGWLSWINYLRGPRVPIYATAHGTGLPNIECRVGLKSQPVPVCRCQPVPEGGADWTF